MRNQLMQSEYNRRGRRGKSLGLVLVGLLALAGCSSSGSLGVGAKGIATARNRTIEHESCDLEAKSAERVDANGDSKPDLTVVKDGSREICRAADLDFDGRIDMWTYFDEAGRLRRRELDFDRDGNIDEIQLYKSGEIAEKQRASTLARRLDTWEFYSGGRLTRAERDADADGRVDQWWDYKTPDCPIIRTDGDGNGEPDPNNEVDYCKESGYKPPEQAAPTAAPMLQKETAALPTETSNREVPADKASENPEAPSTKGENVKGNGATGGTGQGTSPDSTGKGDTK